MKDLNAIQIYFTFHKAYCIRAHIYSFGKLYSAAKSICRKSAACQAHTDTRHIFHSQARIQPHMHDTIRTHHKRCCTAQRARSLFVRV